MARRVLGFAAILTLTLYGITAAGAAPALAARQRTARTTTTTAAPTADSVAPTTTTTAAPRPPRTTTTATTATTAPPAAPTVTHSLQTAVTPAVAPDGSGTMTPTFFAVSAGSTQNTLTFTYTADPGGLSNGTVALVVPSNWSAPSTNHTSATYTSASTGTLTISSRTITVSGLTLAGGGTLTIVYGDRSFGGAGVTAPTTPIFVTWFTKEMSQPGGTLTNLAAGSPEGQITAKDGTGTLTTPTKSAIAGSTGNTIVFTFTAPAGGVSDGIVSIDTPTGWSAPSTTTSDPGYFTASAGTTYTDVTRMGVFGFTLLGGQTLTITYGAKTGGGPGATAPSTAGPQTWQAAEQSSGTGIQKGLAASPTITVVSDSTMVAEPDAASAASIHNEMSFIYTAPTGGLNNGAVTLTVPTGWSAPSVTTTAAGYTTANAGTLTVSLRTITVSGLTLAGGGTVTINYGDRSLGGAGATAPTTPVVQTWPVSEKATSGGTLVPAASPSVTVAAKDGTGTVTTPTKNVSASSTGNTITFTFTAPAGGVKHGELKIQVPSGWSGPQEGTPTDPGYFTASAGTTYIDGPRMGVFDIALSAGQTLTVTYGDKTGGGPGATAPSTPASLQKWLVGERSSEGTGGAIKSLLTSPAITVNGADGGGTMTITSPVPDPDPTSTHQVAVRSGSSGNTIVFTFKAPVGGMANGAVRLNVPADWPHPSLGTTDPGYTKISASGVGVLMSGQTITVSNVNLSAGSSFTISYGVKTSGGPGATAPMIAGSETWPVQERSTAGGTLANLGTSPATLIPTHNIEPNGSHGCNGTLGGGSGTFCFMLNQFSTTTGGTVTFANFSGSTHDVDRCTPDVCNGVGPGDGGDPNFGGSPDLHPGYQYSYTFNGTGAAAGTYNYRCSIHGYAVMHGTITVS